jgi:2,4-dienoyl-CoA reductase-like NADH-dependent reductase (Old Yellow Enzyme family)
VNDSDPTPLFVAAAKMLDGLGIAYLELREGGAGGGAFGETEVPRQSPMIRPHFKGPLVLNNNYNLERAQADFDSGLADAISFGRPFIANPDLVERLRDGTPLNLPRTEHFYTQGEEGYLDYPTRDEIKAVA